MTRTARVVAAAVVTAVLAGCTAAAPPTVKQREWIFDLNPDELVASGNVVGVRFPVPAITDEALARGMTVVVWWRPDFSMAWRALPYSFHEGNDTHAVTFSFTVSPGEVGLWIESGDPLAVLVWRDLAVGKIRVVLTSVVSLTDTEEASAR